MAEPLGKQYGGEIPKPLGDNFNIACGGVKAKT